MESGSTVSDALFKEMMQQSPVAMALLNRRWECEYSNPAFQQITGSGLVPAPGRAWLDNIFAEDIERLKPSNNLDAQQAPYQAEARFRRADGLRWGNINISCVSDGRFLCIIEDISRYRQAFDGAAEKAAVLQALIENTTASIFSFDSNFNYTAFNNTHKQHVKMGRGVEIQPGDNYLDLARGNSGVDGDKTQAIFQRVMAGETVETVEEFGEPGLFRAWFSMICTPIFGDRGHVTGMGVFCQDITERTKLQKVYEDNAQLLDSLLGNLPVIVYRVDKDGRLTFSDGSGLTVLGLQSEGITGKSVFTLFPEAEEQLHKAISGELQQFVTRLHRDTGEIYFENFVFPDRNNPEGIVGFSIDITPYKMAEREILQKHAEIELQKSSLAELNTFKDKVLAIVSHDLRGPIGSLITALSMSDMLTGKEKQEIQAGITVQLEALNNLLDNLLRWAAQSFQKKSTEIELLDIHAIAQRNIEILDSNARSKLIGISNNIPASTEVRANYDQVNIVIRNLIANAIKFTPENGKIMLSSVAGDRNISISVTDTGVGMSAEQLDRLFSHTHSSTYGTSGEKGTGLGLLLSKEYVEASGGTIAVSSRQFEGSTFTVTLPMT